VYACWQHTLTAKSTAVNKDFTGQDDTFRYVCTDLKCFYCTLLFHLAEKFDAVTESFLNSLDTLDTLDFCEYSCGYQPHEPCWLLAVYRRGAWAVKCPSHYSNSNSNSKRFTCYATPPAESRLYDVMGTGGVVVGC